MICKRTVVQEIEIIISVPDDEELPKKNELDSIVNRCREKFNQPIEKIELKISGDRIDAVCSFKPIPFERIRRITGYLVGDIDRFNDAKRAEVADRVKHEVSDSRRMRDTDADGLPDYIDGSYSKVQDIYMSLSASEYERIYKADRQILKNCCRDDEGNFILKCTPEQKSAVKKILSRNCVPKMYKSF